jgi:hypothetical protein
MNRVRRTVVGWYPKDVRDRYGAEIEDLLESSKHPGRDLANVAWHALTERRPVPSGRHLVRALGLLTAPIWFAVAAYFGYMAPGLVVGMLQQYGGYTDLNDTRWLAPSVLAVAGVVAGVGRRHRIVSPGAVVPVALTAGLLLTPFIPFVNLFVGVRAGTPETCAAATWGAALIVVARLGRSSAPVLVGGGILVNELALTVYGLAAHGAAPLAQWPDAMAGTVTPLTARLAILPAVLTIGTAYALGVVHGAQARTGASAQVAPPEPGDPATDQHHRDHREPDQRRGAELAPGQLGRVRER